MPLFGYSSSLKGGKVMGHRVSRKRMAMVIWAAGNRNLLIQVGLNLINNAVDAMADSEVKGLRVRLYTVKDREVAYKTGFRPADSFKMAQDRVVLEVTSRPGSGTTLYLKLQPADKMDQIKGQAHGQ